MSGLGSIDKAYSLLRDAEAAFALEMARAARLALKRKRCAQALEGLDSTLHRSKARLCRDLADVKKLRRAHYATPRVDGEGNHTVVELPMEIIRLILGFYLRLVDVCVGCDLIELFRGCLLPARLIQLVPAPRLRAHVILTWLRQSATTKQLRRRRRLAKAMATRDRVSTIVRCNMVGPEGQEPPYSARVRWKQDHVSASNWPELRAKAVQQGIAASFRYTYNHLGVEITFLGPAGVLEFRCPDADKVAQQLKHTFALVTRKRGQLTAAYAPLAPLDGGFCVRYRPPVANTTIYLGRTGNAPIVFDP